MAKKDARKNTYKPYPKYGTKLITWQLSVAMVHLWLNERIVRPYGKAGPMFNRLNILETGRGA